MLEELDAVIIKKIGVTNARRAGRFLVGVIPSIGTLAMIIHCIILLMGGESHLASLLFKYAFLWFVLLTILSIAFEFCWVHRAFCLYNYIIGACIEYQHLVGFGEWLTPMRWTTLIIGLLLLFAFFRRNCWKEFIEHSKHYK